MVHGMSASEEKILGTLEFPSVRDILKRYCITLLGKNVADRLQPFDEMEKARRALNQVTEMKAFFFEGGKIIFAGACDAVKILEGALEKNQSIDPKNATAQQKVMARLSIIMRGTTAAQGDARH